MTCDLLPDPRLGHACNSWGRSGNLSASRRSSSLSSCDSKWQVTLFLSQRKFWVWVLFFCFFRYNENGRRVRAEIRSSSRRHRTGSVSVIYKLYFSGKWSGKWWTIELILTPYSVLYKYRPLSLSSLFSLVRECSSVRTGNIIWCSGRKVN